MDIEVEKPIGKGPFSCDQCNKVFPKWPQLKKHKKTHIDEKPYQCAECTASFNIQVIT